MRAWIRACVRKHGQGKAKAERVAQKFKGKNGKTFFGTVESRFNNSRFNNIFLNIPVFKYNK